MLILSKTPLCLGHSQLLEDTVHMHREYEHNFALHSRFTDTNLYRVASRFLIKIIPCKAHKYTRNQKQAYCCVQRVYCKYLCVYLKQNQVRRGCLVVCRSCQFDFSQPVVFLVPLRTTYIIHFNDGHNSGIQTTKEYREFIIFRANLQVMIRS